MARRFEDLWSTAADDGATCPIGVSDRRPGPPVGSPEPEGEDLGLMLEAWSLERARRIEAALLVKEARRVIARFVADGAASPGTLVRARRVLAAIRAVHADDD